MIALLTFAKWSPRVARALALLACLAPGKTMAEKPPAAPVRARRPGLVVDDDEQRPTLRVVE